LGKKNKKDGRRKRRKPKKNEEMPTLFELLKKLVPTPRSGQTFRDKSKYQRKGRRKEKIPQD